MQINILILNRWVYLFLSLIFYSLFLLKSAFSILLYTALLFFEIFLEKSIYFSVNLILYNVGKF